MLRIDFINVGYGDAILIRDTTAHFSMLVDTGDVDLGLPLTGSARISAADFLKKEHLTQLDLLVLTHLHRDHSGGLLPLLKDVTVGNFWTSYLPDKVYWGQKLKPLENGSAGAVCLMESMEIYLTALAKMAQAKTVIELITATSSQYQLTDALSANVYLEKDELFQRQASIWQQVLQGNPNGEQLDALDKFINNTSIRMRLEYAGQSVELPGDVYAACWQKHNPAPCNIVKLPHHGHVDSLTPELLAMLKPQTVVISVSNDRKDDCPSQRVIKMINESGSNLQITDAVKVDSNPAQVHSAVHFEQVDG